MPEKTPTQAPAAAPTEKPPVPQAAMPSNGHPKPKTDVQMYPVGIVGVQIEEEERKVGPNEAPPMPINEKLMVIGKPTPRLDGRAKVTGAAKYSADINLPGMLFAKLITSTVPHAVIKSIDTSAAEKHPAFRAIHILDRDRSAAQTEEEKNDRWPRVRYVGQPLGAIAAPTQAQADEIARLVKITYEQKPFVVDPDKAKQPNAPVIFSAPAEQSGTAGGGGGPRDVQQHGNVRGPVAKGDADKAKSAFNDADVTVELDFRTQVQTHCALETHGLVADWKPDLLTVWASTQGTSSVRDELAAVFNLKKSQVRVITEYMGGGFGAKFGAGNYGVLATHLSKKAGAPVRLMLDRREEHLCVGNRPSSIQKIKIAAKKDGTLVAMQLQNYGTAGVGTGAGASGPTQNLYTCPAIYTEDSDVFTNAGPSSAFRAPGHPQGAFSLEQAIDALAEKLKIDPLALRDKIDDSDARREERRIGAERIGWKRRKPAGSDSGTVKRGMGVAQAIWYRISNRDSHCEVRVTQDGSVEILSSVQDIGGGIRTALAQIVAETLGLKPTDVTVKIGDTTYPQGPNSGGSVTTNSISPVARNAAWKVREQFAQQIAPALGGNAQDVEFGDGRVFLKTDATRSLTFKQAAKKMKTETIASRADRSEDFETKKGPRGKGSGGLGGVQFCQVAVDTTTGVIKVEKVVAVHDCGRPINPLAVQSQVNGGVIQGISYALYEDRILDRNTGIMVNTNLEQYKIAGSREMPEIDAQLIEQYWGKSSTDAAGIGEPATVPTAACVANAVYNAIGVRITQIPMTPSAVLEAIASKKA